MFVLGYGSSGKAAEALGRELGFEVKVFDGEMEVVGDADFAVVSPGLPMTSPLVVGCRRRGIPLVSEMQFGCEELKRRGWRLVAITGSKGKSSVVKLVADALGGVACGNYGLPVSEVALRACKDGLVSTAVVEVSSFMMETTRLPGDFFDAAAVLNLQEDHLDRHGSVAAYHALKLKLLDFARVRVSPVSADEAASAEVSGIVRGSYFDNEILRTNAACAIRLMQSAGLDDASIAAAFRRFGPLPHRFELVEEIDGVRYVDDSKATSVAALIAGVTMAAEGASVPRVRLIAGGLAKGDDPAMATPYLTEWVKKVYIIGCCAEKFFAAWFGSVDCEVSGTLERAVESSMRDACSGDCVLLSPGCASFDQFKSFGERGDRFVDFVKKGKKKR